MTPFRATVMRKMRRIRGDFVQKGEEKEDPGTRFFAKKPVPEPSGKNS
jgi:hypothetical protein